MMYDAPPLELADIFGLMALLVLAEIVVIIACSGNGCSKLLHRIGRRKDK